MLSAFQDNNNMLWSFWPCADCSALCDYVQVVEVSQPQRLNKANRTLTGKTGEQ
jgi:hypothetical protein